MKRLIHSQFLAATGKLIEGVSTTAAGNIDYRFDEAGVVAGRRRIFARDLGTEVGYGVLFRLLDRDVIVDVDESFRGIGMTGKLPLRADTLVTKTPGVGLFLPIADCQGITLYDPRNRVIALAHCSRKSTHLQLVAKSVTYLEQQYGSQSDELLAYLGPSIGMEYYVFDEWIREQLTGWGNFVRPVGEGKYSVNVRGYNLEQLRLAGLRPKHIEDSAIDTYSSTEFYSHVQAGREGVPEARFAQYVELR